MRPNEQESTNEELDAYPGKINLFVEFPIEWNGNPYIRFRNIQKMLDSRVSDDGQPLHDYLRENHISLSVSVPQDSDPYSLEVIREVSDRNVSCCAWVGVKDHYGYFLNDKTATQYMGRALHIAEWAERSNISLRSIGLDIEPPFQTMAHMDAGRMGAFARDIVEYRKAFLGAKRRMNPRSVIQDGISVLQEKYRMYVEAYTAPPLLHSILGLPSPTNINGRVEMDYSSLYPMRQLLFRLLWDVNHYPAFGIVNGIPGQTPGRDFSGKYKDMSKDEIDKIHLTDRQLENDIRLANSISKHRLSRPLSSVYVFAMNSPSVALRVNSIRKRVLG